jgi:hypothetical protein
MREMKRSKVATWLLLAAFVLLAGLQLLVVAGKTAVDHDEAIS